MPVTYTPKERIGWSVAFAAIPMLGGVYWLPCIALGAAVYFRGPRYHHYRLSQRPIHNAG